MSLIIRRQEREPTSANRLLSGLASLLVKTDVGAGNVVKPSTVQIAYFHVLNLRVASCGNAEQPTHKTD